eukprot:4727068-Prymnesium_polylepis.2
MSRVCLPHSGGNRPGWSVRARESTFGAQPDLRGQMTTDGRLRIQPRELPSESRDQLDAAGGLTLRRAYWSWPARRPSPSPVSADPERRSPARLSRLPPRTACVSSSP